MKFLLNAISMTRKRPPHFDIESMYLARDSLNSFAERVGLFGGQKFESISVIIGYGLVDTTRDPEIGRVLKKYKELPVTIELDIREVCKLDRESLALRFEVAILESLVRVAEKYKVGTEEIKDRLAELEG